MFAMAGTLLATSCSNDELDAVQSGNEVQVTFSLGVEGGIGVKTRAISDGTGADKLIYAVFDEDGNRISSITKVERTNVTFPTTETLTLAKGQTYKVAFWAQDADCSTYTLDDKMNVTVDYANAANNDETRDAFFKTETFTVTGTASIDVVLKRPFAQINVGVTKEDWKAAVASGITIDQSKVVVKNAATSLNLVTGAVSNPTDVTYNLATIPAEELKVDTDKDGNISASETYNWLSMSYILVNDGSEDGAQKTTLEGLEFTFKPESGNDITLKDGLTSVPVQRNWRTNILGKLLTGDITFNISIDPIYDGDYIYPDGSAQELIMAAANGGKVVLTEDVTLEQPIIVSDGVTMHIDLNGHDIINKTQNSDLETYALVAAGNSVLNIEGNGKIQAIADDTDDDGWRMAVYAYGDAVVNIMGGNFYNSQKTNAQLDLIYADGNAVINISGGTFQSNCYSNRNGKIVYWVLNKKNGSNAQINVTGGTFINFNPASPQTDDDATYVVEGYSSVKVNDEPATYQVVKGESVSSVNDITTAINKAIENGSNTIYATEPLVFKEDIELDGQGITLTGDPVRFEANATVKNLTFENASGEIGFQKKQSAVYVTSKSSTQKSLVFENCTFKDAYWDAIQITNPNLESISIKNCYFENNTQWPNNTVDGKNLNRRYIHLETNDLVNTTVEITGCTFVNVSPSYCNDSAITIYGYAWDNMTINNNTVKGDGADNLTTNIIWINDGVTSPYKLMSVDDISNAFVYTAN